MQKKIIALAIAGLVSGAAFADTNVTVYGVADVSFDAVRAGSGTAAGSSTGNYTRVSSNSSYLGFKGSEELGNNLKGVFQIETTVGYDAPSTGYTGTFGATRDTYAGLVGGFGSMVLGTLTTPTRALGTAIDVNAGAASIGANAGLIGGAGFDSRKSNTAMYTSPNFSGFNVAAAYVSGENKTTDATVAKQNYNAWDLGLNYNNGPILVGATYVLGRDRDVPDTEMKNTRVAGAYNFAQGSVRVLWNSAKSTTNTTEQKQNVWGIGGTFKASGNGNLIAQYYKANNTSGNLGAPDTGAKLFELGYEHNLSKRTMIKVIYARVSNDSAAAFNFGNGGVNNVTNGVDPSGLQVGIRHSF